MLSKQIRHVKLPLASSLEEEIEIVFAGEAARGRVILRECLFGLELILPEASRFPVAVLDFWHTSPNGQAERGPDEPAPVGQLVLHSPAQTDDALGRVRFFPAQTVVDFERDVTLLAGSPPTYGYACSDYPPVELLVDHQGVQVYRALDAHDRPAADWFTTDPDCASVARAGPHFGLRDLFPDPTPDVRSADYARALADPAFLRDSLRAALAAGAITADGWQARPPVRSA